LQKNHIGCIDLHRARELFGQIVECNELANDKYIDMLTSMKRFYKNGFSVTGVSDAKMVLLIDAGIIYMNPESLKSIGVIIDIIVGKIDPSDWGQFYHLYACVQIITGLIVRTTNNFK